MEKLTSILSTAAVATLLCLPAASWSPQAADAPDLALAVIRPEAIRAQIRFLADDLLEGRGTGARGYELAARYVAAQFEQIGLEPAGTAGTYLQPVPLRRIELDAGQSSLNWCAMATASA